MRVGRTLPYEQQRPGFRPAAAGYVDYMQWVYERYGSPEMMRRLNSRLQTLERDYQMARKSKTNAPIAWEKAKWEGFRDVPLSTSDKEEFAAWDMPDAELLNGVAEMVGSGHKVVLSPTNEGKGCAASATGAYKHCPNAGYTMSAFAPDVWTAIRVLLYKHFVLCDGLWESHDGDIPADIG